MNLLSLRYFLEIARTLNFTEASKNLHISQPALSQQMKLLEKQLGMKLFYRTTRKVELTEEGRFLYDELASSLAFIENTIFSMMKAKTLPRAIKIATVPSAASLYVPKVIQQLHEHQPDLEVQMKETTSFHVIESVHNKECHVGFIRTPQNLAQLKSKELHYLEFRRFPFQAVVSTSHPLANRKSIKLNELKDFPFLHYDSAHSPALFHLVNEACQKAGFTPQVICTGSELLTISYLVSANIGVTLMPTDMISLIQFSKICSLDIQDQQIESSISAVWLKNTIRLNTKHLIKVLHELKRLEE
ncbi:transcriptional regulator, LysR family [Seinonella peptonophila]|uniref:Transcriptional regulator, LysR family n=1 Tax=Seinonella peptonophila TaxID=112248 RepID=A0A1M4TXG4_9BACL|nr:LysR family transcriptional regulator [Seinonella peptonophila]SHE49122.1 transcriptional regulator, LysR family [Seinonella peptonophila]